MKCESLYTGFFFQAEDGIRDLVRSRGLGDVYKRQELGSEVTAVFAYERSRLATEMKDLDDVIKGRAQAVSYTHLTLPTIYSV